MPAAYIQPGAFAFWCHRVTVVALLALPGACAAPQSGTSVPETIVDAAATPVDAKPANKDSKPATAGSTGTAGASGGGAGALGAAGASAGAMGGAGTPGSAPDAGSPDTNTGAAGMAGPAPSKRPDVKGLALWLDARVGVVQENGKVVRWEDQSGKNNHAVQTWVPNQPTVGTAMNGMPSIHFSGKVMPEEGSGTGGPFLRIKDNASLQWGTGDFTIVAVVGYDNLLDHSHRGVMGSFFSKRDENAGSLLLFGNWPFQENPKPSYGQSAIHFGVGDPAFETTHKGWNDGRVRIYIGRRVGTKIEARINGTPDGQGTANVDISYKGCDVTIGSWTAPDVPANQPADKYLESKRSLKGELLAIIGVGGAMSDADLMALESFLKTEYKTQTGPNDFKITEVKPY